MTDSLARAAELISQALLVLDEAKVGINAAPHLDLGLHLLAAEIAAEDGGYSGGVIARCN